MALLPDDFDKVMSIREIEKYGQVETEIKDLVEFDINFDTGEFVIDDEGKIAKVYDLDALKVRVWLKLNTYSGRYGIFSYNYGNTLKDYIGQSRFEHLPNELIECLVDGVYITDLTNITIDSTEDNIKISFTVVNIYDDYDETFIIGRK